MKYKKPLPINTKVKDIDELTEGQKNNTTNDGVVRYSIRLTEDDLSNYLGTGTRANKNKQISYNNGEKIILTSEEEIASYIDNAVIGKEKNIVSYGKVNSRLAEDVMRASNGKIDIKDAYLELVPDDLQHSYNNHHIAKQDGDIDMPIDIFKKIPYFLDTYDDIIYARQFNSGNKRVLLSKKINNGRIIIIETVSSSRNALQFKNAYCITEQKYIDKYYDKIIKSSANSRGSKNSNISLRDASASNTNISQDSYGVNNNSMPHNEKHSYKKQENIIMRKKHYDINQIEKKKEELFKKVDNIINNFHESPENITEYLKFNSRFYQYSENNTMLIYEQNSMARYCASYKAFQDMGYQVQKGQVGMKILVPHITTYFFNPDNEKWMKLSEGSKEQQMMVKSGQLQSKQHRGFHIGTVFEIGQTDCPVDDYPKIFNVGYPDAEHNLLYNAVVNFAREQNITFEERNFPSISTRGYFDKSTNLIAISDKLRDSMKLSVGTHELAHAIMHSSEVASERPTMQKEIEADSLSLMLREHLGITDIENTRQAHLQTAYKRYIKEAELNADKGDYPDLSVILENVNKAYMSIIEDFDNSVSAYMEHHNQQLTETERFSKTIDDFCDGILNPTKPIFVCQTTEVMKICGASNPNVFINQKTLKKVFSNDKNKFEHPHNLPKEIVQDLPNQLQNPIMVFNGSKENSLVFITNLYDQLERTVIVSCQLDRKLYRTNINQITSIYGRNNITNYLDTQIKKGNLIGCQKNIANKMLQSLGLKLPQGETFIDYTSIISDIRENVNTNNEADYDEPLKISLNDYLAAEGLQSPISDWTTDKSVIPRGMTVHQRAQHIKDGTAAIDDYHDRRAAAIAEYNAKLESGAIVAPSRIDELIAKASGHPDNSSTKAAIRLLHKRGYSQDVNGNWIKEESNIEMEHTLIAAKTYNQKDFDELTANKRIFEFVHCTFDNVIFTDQNILKLSDCKLNNCIFDNFNSNNIDMSNSVLSDCKIENSDFNHCSLLSASIYHSTIQNSNFSNAHLTLSTIRNCNINNTELSGATLNGAQLNSVYFKELIVNEKIEGLTAAQIRMDGATRGELEIHIHQIFNLLEHSQTSEQDEYLTKLNTIAEYERHLNISPEESIVILNYDTAQWQANENITAEQINAVSQYIANNNSLTLAQVNDIRQNHHPLPEAPLSADEYYQNLKYNAFVDRFDFGNENSLGSEAREEIIKQLITDGITPVEVLSDESKLQWYAFNCNRDEIDTSELLKSINQNEMQTVAIFENEQHEYEILHINEDYQLERYSEELSSEYDLALDSVLNDDNVAKLVEYKKLLQASSERDLKPLAESENLKYPYISINSSENATLLKHPNILLKDAIDTIKSENVNALVDDKLQKVNLSLLLRKDMPFNVELKLGTENGELVDTLNNLANENSQDSNELKAFLKEQGLYVDESSDAELEFGEQLDFFSETELI